jgi:O-methyltransferase involved in polyketide biosynthesis
VTQYLTPEAVDGTLAFIANHSGEGSSVIFDYMYTSLLDGTVKHGEVSKMRNDRVLRREMLAYGIPEGTIGTFMEQRGFCNVQNADHVFLHQAYFTGANQNRKVADGYAIVSATVKPHISG